MCLNCPCKSSPSFASAASKVLHLLLRTSIVLSTKYSSLIVFFCCVFFDFLVLFWALFFLACSKLKPLWIHWCCVRSAFDFHWPNFQLAVLESVRRCVLSIIGTYEDATAHPLHSKLSSFFTKLDDYDLLWDTTRKARDFQDENLIATVDAIYCYLEEHGQLPSQNRGSSSSSRPTVLQYLKACGMQLGKRSRSIEQLCAVLLRADLVNADVPLSDFRSLLLCLLARAVNGIAKVPVVSQWCLSEVGTIVDSKCAELLQRKLASASTKRRRQAKTKGAVTKSSSKRSRLR